MLFAVDIWSAGVEEAIKGLMRWVCAFLEIKNLELKIDKKLRYGSHQPKVSTKKAEKERLDFTEKYPEPQWDTQFFKIVAWTDWCPSDQLENDISLVEWQSEI